MQENSAIYLDFNAGAPLHPKVREALLFYFQSPGAFPSNPSSQHFFGRRSKRLLGEARERVAESLGQSVSPDEIVFTSSGTEANQMVIRSHLEWGKQEGRPIHWITTAVEHSSNLKMIPWIKARGGRVSTLPHDSSGRPLLGTLRGLWQEEALQLVSVIWANNETGVLSPVAELAEEVASLGGFLHVDAAQAWGKVPFDLNRFAGIGFASFSGSKIGALPGTGALWIRQGIPFFPTWIGSQEKDRRGGTENVLGALSLGIASAELMPVEFAKKTAPLQSKLEREVRSHMPQVIVNGENALRITNTSNFSFPGISGEGLVAALDLEGYCVSAGSACSSGALEPSHVLMALGHSREQAKASVRVSLSGSETESQIEGFARALQKIEQRMGRKSELRY